MTNTSDPKYETYMIVLVYCIAKVVGLSLVWISGYVAERDMNEAFTRLVYTERKEAPPMWRMVSTFLTTYMVLSVMLVMVFAMGMFIWQNKPIESLITISWLLFDMFVSIVLVAALGGTIAQCVSNQVYFNYRTEGLRAIRAVRKMIVGILLLVGTFPFSASLTTERTHKTLQMLMESPLAKRIQDQFKRNA